MLWMLFAESLAAGAGRMHAVVYTVVSHCFRFRSRSTVSAWWLSSTVDRLMLRMFATLTVSAGVARLATATAFFVPGSAHRLCGQCGQKALTCTTANFFF